MSCEVPTFNDLKTLHDSVLQQGFEKGSLALRKALRATLGNGNVLIPRQMGLGGDDSWGALPLEKYPMKAGPLSYRFRIRPIPATEAPMALSKVTMP